MENPSHTHTHTHTRILTTLLCTHHSMFFGSPSDGTTIVPTVALVPDSENVRDTDRCELGRSMVNRTKSSPCSDCVQARMVRVKLCERGHTFGAMCGLYGDSCWAYFQSAHLFSFHV